MALSMKRTTYAGVVLLLVCGNLLFSGLVLAEDVGKPTPDSRMDWWRESRFGMFIHWGVYAVPAGTHDGKQIRHLGEWIMCNAKIPVARYKEYASEFNPVKYDPDAWMRMAKEAGMKYVVITAKHHDGFALFDSAVTDWDIVDATPYKKDLLAPLAEACREHDLKLGFYYSQAQDWTHKGGANNHWDPSHQGSMDDYIKNIAVPQVRELLTKYGDDIPAVLWWDTPNGMNPERARPLAEVLKLKPGIICNDRLGGGFSGDYETPEQNIPANALPGMEWETCMTMNGTWGYKSYLHNWKSSKNIIRTLAEINSKGGNFLLNVGPTAEGEIPQASIEILQAIGDWMKIYGESIYGSTAGPFRKLAWGCVSAMRQGDHTTLYLHVFDWPQDGRLLLPGLKNPILEARLLDGGNRLDASLEKNGVYVNLPMEAPDAADSVIELRIKGRPEVDHPSISAAADGSFVLGASDAVIHKSDDSGRHLPRIGPRGGVVEIYAWNNPKTWVTWDVDFDQPGSFLVKVTSGSVNNGQATIGVGDAVLAVTIPSNGSFKKHKTVTLGQLTIEKKGKSLLSLKPVVGKWANTSISNLILTPVQ